MEAGSGVEFWGVNQEVGKNVRRSAELGQECEGVNKKWYKIVRGLAGSGV